VLKEYGNRVRLIFKDLPLPSHEHAMAAHEAARCAGSLGRYWAYHDKLFASQPQFERADLIRYATDVGLSREKFTACLDAHRFAPQVEADVEQARALGVRGTPTFVINGRVVAGALPVEDFRTLINEALRDKP
jgi:protein-disulfide isomerase